MISGEGKFQLSTGIFYGVILLLLWPLFSLTWIFTHDGPAHVYNACLIREILSGNELLSDFIVLKKFPEPNWTGHFILAALSAVFPANVSEKIFLGAYIILFPWFFRRLLKRINNNNETVALLVLPFIYSYFFFGGLYNFIAGVTILFAALSIILPLYDKEGNSKHYWTFGFSILLYFSHLLVFGIFIILISIAHLFAFYSNKKRNHNKGFFLSAIPLLISLSASLFMAIVYFSTKQFSSSGNSHVTFSAMMGFLTDITSIITLQYHPEDIYSRIIFYLLIILLSTSLFFNFRNKSRQNPNSKPFYQRQTYWIVATGLMLLLFLIIPDQAATGGVIKFRFELFLFLFLILWIGAIPLIKWMNWPIRIIISSWIIFKLIYFLPMMKNLDKETEQIMTITAHMEENSILLPLNYSDNWMHGNLFNYAGTQKNILVLDNYETGMPHFPLEWKENRNPVKILGSFNGNLPLCADVTKFEKETNRKVDYIVTWNYKTRADSCSIAIQQSLDSNYQLVFRNGENLKLYKVKR